LAARAARRDRCVEVELGRRRLVVPFEGSFVKLELPGLGIERIVGWEERVVIRRARWAKW
jgi:hypothetical protein